MDLATAEAFMANRTVQRYLAQIDEDADIALEEKNGVVSALSMLPRRYVSDYHNDATALERAQDAFNLEWNRIQTAQARDGRGAMTAYSRYVLTLGVLERDNARFGAFARARTFTLWAGLGRIYLRRTKRVHKALRRNIAFLNNLHNELRRARREETEAQAQRVLNVAITAVSMCITVTTFGLGLGIAASIFAIQAGADAALGPSGPVMSGTAVNAATGIASLPGAMSTPNARLLGAAGGIFSLVSDTEEVALAQSNIRVIADMMRQYQRQAPRLMRELNAAAREVNTARQLYEGAVRQARAEARSFRANDAARRGLLRELSRL